MPLGRLSSWSGFALHTGQRLSWVWPGFSAPPAPTSQPWTWVRSESGRRSCTILRIPPPPSVTEGASRLPTDAAPADVAWHFLPGPASFLGARCLDAVMGALPWGPAAEL